jgi:hypothetical protein
VSDVCRMKTEMGQHAPDKSRSHASLSMEVCTLASVERIVTKRRALWRRAGCLSFLKWTAEQAMQPIPRSMLWTSVVGATMIRDHHRRRLWPNGRSVGLALHVRQASRRRWALTNRDRIGKRQPFWHRSAGRRPFTLLRDRHWRELQWMARLRTQTVSAHHTRAHRPAAGQHSHHGSRHSRAGHNRLDNRLSRHNRHNRHSPHSRHRLPRAGCSCTLQRPATHQRLSRPSRRRSRRLKMVPK